MDPDTVDEPPVPAWVDPSAADAYQAGWATADQRPVHSLPRRQALRILRIIGAAPRRTPGPR